MINVGIFVVIWNILGHFKILFPFGNLCSGHLVYFPNFGMCSVSRKIWQPWVQPRSLFCHNVSRKACLR
jgi:hypothetical protein